MIDWQRVKDVWQNRVIFGATAEVSRLFIRCHRCRRIVPAWRVMSATSGGVPGCWCGSSDMQPATVPFLAGAYWLFLRGLLIRKWVLRKKEWDARIPWRQYGAS